MKVFFIIIGFSRFGNVGIQEKKGLPADPATGVVADFFSSFSFAGWGGGGKTHCFSFAGKRGGGKTCGFSFAG